MSDETPIAAPPRVTRTLRELIIEGIDADAPITSPLLDGHITNATAVNSGKRRTGSPYTKITMGVAPHLISPNDLMWLATGGPPERRPKFIPYVVWVPIDVHERTSKGNE